MGLFEGTILWLAGTVLFALSVQQLRRANPHEKIPLFFSRPENHPGEVYVYRAIALVLLLFAAQAWAGVLDGWSTLLILLGAIPAVILNTQHNRMVERHSAISTSP